MVPSQVSLLGLVCLRSGDLIKAVYNSSLEPEARPNLKTGKFKKFKTIDGQGFLILDCDGVEILIPMSRLVRIESMKGLIMTYCRECGFYNWYKKEEPPVRCKRCGEKL